MIKQIFLFTLLLSCSVYSNSKRIQEQIDNIVNAVDLNMHIGIEIVSLTTGKIIYSNNASHLFLPASCIKLMTAAAALDLLGPDYRFRTVVYTDGQIEKGVVTGNLWIRGSGDPELSIYSLEELIVQLKRKGIQKINGNLYSDLSGSDGICQGPGWAWDDGAVDWNCPLDALMVNRGCVDIWVKPNRICGVPPDILIDPGTDYIEVKNLALTAKEDETLSVERRWMTKENVIDIKGNVSLAQEAKKFTIPVESPHLYALHLFSSLLRKEGITLMGEIGEGKGEPSFTEVAAYTSRPLFEILVDMVKASDNLIADTLFKQIGQQVVGGLASWKNGQEAIKSFLMKKVGLNATGLMIVDGSGLSRYNLLSPHQLVTLLTWIDQQAISPYFTASLPISGVDGTLKKRMTQPFIRGKVCAKTGTLMGVSTLSGYAMTQNGERLVFSIMINGFTKQPSEYKREVEDQILEWMIKNIDE
jgi:D-alanyl-D-alanine carboxypeptidase/D-alanyl-D-alanine-endopeptidase (penicillin-binding protein 4)